MTKADPPRSLEGSTSTLLQASLKQVLNELSKFIEEERATFSCGGSITIDPTPRKGTDISDPPSNSQSSPPVTIYWSGDNEQLYKVSLPHRTPEGKSPSRLDQLLANCSPVTPRAGEKHALDTSHRHVGALDPDRFSTSFHLSDFGILSTIEQLLLPCTNSQSGGQFEFRRVKTELYKLNVFLPSAFSLFSTNISRYIPLLRGYFETMPTPQSHGIHSGPSSFASHLRIKAVA